MLAPPIEATAYWLPLVTAGVGFASGAFTEWARDRRAYKRERDARDSARHEQRLERQNDFQRQTLLDLQDALLKLMQATTNLHHADLRNVEMYGKIGVLPYSKEVDAGNMQANAQTALLGVRVRDDLVRKLLEEVKNYCTSATLELRGKPESRLAWEAAGQSFVKLNTRIGEVLRQLDDIEL